MKITWYLNDGFVGTRSFTTTIDDSDIETCETEQEYIELIETYIQEDFTQRISYHYTVPPFNKKTNQEDENY